MTMKTTSKRRSYQLAPSGFDQTKTLGILLHLGISIARRMVGLRFIYNTGSIASRLTSTSL
jgi:hypothetical protein